jgi:lysosomal acid lipase/cholesteryl ester hydrolase
MTSDEVSLVNCPERIKIFFAHFPCGSSFKSVNHFKQLYNSKQFQYYDYNDEDENISRYDQPKPKLYDLNKIKNFKFVICAGKSDRLTTLVDIKWLSDRLSENNNVKFYEFELMGHLSFLLSTNILWFNPIMEDINNIIDNIL